MSERGPERVDDYCTKFSAFFISTSLCGKKRFLALYRSFIYIVMQTMYTVSRFVSTSHLQT